MERLSELEASTTVQRDSPYQDESIGSYRYFDMLNSLIQIKNFLSFLAADLSFNGITSSHGK